MNELSVLIEPVLVNGAAKCPKMKQHIQPS